MNILISLGFILGWNRHNNISRVQGFIWHHLFLISSPWTHQPPFPWGKCGRPAWSHCFSPLSIHRQVSKQEEKNWTMIQRWHKLGNWVPWQWLRLKIFPRGKQFSLWSPWWSGRPCWSYLISSCQKTLSMRPKVFNNLTLLTVEISSKAGTTMNKST